MLDGNQVDHPIWFITTAGLQQSIINSITVYKYKKGEGLIEGTECSVCLCLNATMPSIFIVLILG